MKQRRGLKKRHDHSVYYVNGCWRKLSVKWETKSSWQTSAHVWDVPNFNSEVQSTLSNTHTDILTNNENNFDSEETKEPWFINHLKKMCCGCVLRLTLSGVCSSGLLDEEQVLQFFGRSGCWSFCRSWSCSWFLCNMTARFILIIFIHKLQTLKYFSQKNSIFSFNLKIIKKEKKKSWWHINFSLAKKK